MATCERCGREVENDNQLKEVFYEEGERQERQKKMVCPNCLDEVMNQADKVQGVAGEEKRAAVHLSGDGGAGERESMGERNA
jgi:DNA-directed RNA polymerase subunit RPC12/RpoP